MPRSWPSLPISNSDTRIKAPTLKEHERIAAEAPSFSLPKTVAEEIMLARDILIGLHDEGHSLGQGERYEIYRYNLGLAAKCPSGYTVYLSFEELREGDDEAEAVGGEEAISPPP